MAYHLKRGEAVPEGIRRVVRDELESASGLLGKANGRNRDEAVHEARKSVKKVRAVLRLMSGELGPVAADENRRLRNLAGKLSALRDTAVMVETFDGLRPHLGADLDAAMLDGIHARLLKAKQQATSGALKGESLKKMGDALKQAAKRVNKWPLRRDGFTAIAPGLGKTFRRGRKALDTAREDPEPANYHEWRKRVKDHWYHIRLLEDAWTDVLPAYEKSLKDLETWLGDDHNLVVLRDQLVAWGDAAGDAKQIGKVLDGIDRRQKELRDSAVSLGERIYAVKPREFTRETRNLWKAWQSQPVALENEQKPEDQASRPKPVKAAGKSGAAPAGAVA